MGLCNSKIVQGVEPGGDLAASKNHAKKSHADVMLHDSSASIIHDSRNTSLQSDSTLGFSSVDHPLPTTIAAMAAVSELDWKKGTTMEEQTLGDELDEIQRTAMQSLDFPMCLVGLYDTKKVWYRTNTGHFTPGLSRRGTFCEELTSSHRDHFIVTNAIEDPRFASHPSVANRPFARSYTGVPLLSLGGHLLGTFAVVDFTPRDPSTDEQVNIMKKLAARAVSALQEDVAGRALSPDSFSALPCIWLDISTPEWKVMGTNKEWEELTGVKSSDLARFPGLFSVMMTGDDAELEALRTAVANAAAALDKDGNFACLNSDEKKPSLPAIMAPYDTSGEDLQFVFALKPADRPAPISTGATSPSKNLLWIAEVHARVRAAAPVAPPPVFEIRTSGDELRPIRSSIGSGGRTPLNNGSSAFRSGSSGGNNGVTASRDASIDNGGSMTNSEELNIPARLSTLQLGQLLGKGSYGSVYAGVLKGRPVAVKIIESISGPDQEAQQWEAQFEAFVAIQRSHKNVVPTTDWIKEDSTGQTWIVQELCDLGTLASLYKDKILIDMATGKPDMLSVLDTALDIARGMEYLHSYSVIHGDLSSNNVLLSSSAEADGRGFVAKVTDFGLSRVSKKEITTKTVGTVSHMPPELLVDGVMTKAGDVYSYGVVLWEMWSGKRAWEGASMGQVVFAVTVRDHRLTLPADAPPDLAALVNDCVQTDRNMRPEFSEIVKRLEKIKSDWIAKNPQ